MLMSSGEKIENRGFAAVRISREGDLERTLEDGT